MTRFLYDVAVITDYSRRKIEVNERGLFQHQVQNNCILGTTSDNFSSMLCTKPEKAYISVIQNKTSVKQMPLTNEEPISYEIANSISDYSSVGTLSSTGTTSSSCSSDLAKILWTKVDDDEEKCGSLTNQSKYDTCNQSIDSAMEDTSLHADLVASPSILNQTVKRKTSTLAKAQINKEMLPNFKSSHAQRNITGEGNMNSMGVEKKCSPDTVGSLQSMSLKESRMKDDDKILEANLRRVAEQLFEFDPQIALLSNNVGPINCEGNGYQKNSQICSSLGKSVYPQEECDVYGQSFQDFDYYQNRKVEPQLLKSVNGDISSADDNMWMTVSSGWGESFSQPNTIVDIQKSEGSEQRQEYFMCDERTGHHTQNTATDKTNNVKNVTQHDISLCLEGIDTTKDTPHIQMSQSSICNTSVDRLTKASDNATVLTVNDSGFNSNSSQNVTNNNNTFLQSKSIEGCQEVLPVEKKSALRSTYNIIPFIIDKGEDDASPYYCKIRHGHDFHEFSRFVSSSSLFENVLTKKNVSTLISISQRIVRVRVSKPYMPADPSFEIKNNDFGAQLKGNVKDMTSVNSTVPATDHYGTGFVFYIDSEQFEVRTHSRLVSSTIDAERTEIQFNVYVPETEEWLRVNCKGQLNGFETNIYSHTSILTCATPPILESLLPHFKSIPIKLKSSLFNDSSYFTDSSPEASFSKIDFRADPLLEMQDKDKGISNEKESTNVSFVTELEPASDSLNETGSFFLTNGLESNFDIFQKYSDHDKDSSYHQVANSGSFSYELKENDLEGHFVENPFEYCGIEESLVKSAFESVIETDDVIEQTNYDQHLKSLDGIEVQNLNEIDHLGNNWNQSRKPNASLNCYRPFSRSSTPPADSLRPEHGISSLCSELPGVKGYQLFDSYAGDVLGTSIMRSGVHINSSILDLPFGKWDRESMLYIQNQRRDEYNLFFNTNNNNPHSTHLNNAASESCVDTKDGMKVKNRSCFQEDSENSPRSRLNVFNDIHTRDESCQSLSSIQSFSKILPNSNSCLPQSKSSSHLAPSLMETKACSEDDSWDWDLLGLDSKLLFTTVSDIEMEKLVDDILSDDSRDMMPSILSNEHLSATTMNAQENTALLIAHAHGGFKTVSCGKLSATSNTTPDVKLYDLPSCFGCCGAPILSFDGNGQLYVTTTVHNGTTTLGHTEPSKGFGVSYFTQSANEFSQCTTI